MEKESSVYNTLVRSTAIEGDREAFVRRIGICDPHDLVRRPLESPASRWPVVDFVEMVIGFKEEDGRAHNNKVREASPGSCGKKEVAFGG